MIVPRPKFIDPTFDEIKTWGVLAWVDQAERERLLNLPARELGRKVKELNRRVKNRLYKREYREYKREYCQDIN